MRSLHIIGCLTLLVLLSPLAPSAQSAGDYIIGPQDVLSITVYVFGQVKNPGSYPIKIGTTVLQALSLAGGVTPNGALNRTKVIHIVSGAKRDMKVKLTDVVAPGDTITVPERFF